MVGVFCIDPGCMRSGISKGSDNASSKNRHGESMDMRGSRSTAAAVFSPEATSRLWKITLVNAQRKWFHLPADHSGRASAAGEGRH